MYERQECVWLTVLGAEQSSSLAAGEDLVLHYSKAEGQVSTETEWRGCCSDVILPSSESLPCYLHRDVV